MNGAGRRPLIGIAGATGAVGRSALHRLSNGGRWRLRVGSRGIAAFPVPNGIEAVSLDVFDESSVAAFCRDCDLVVNCAGPSYLILDRVARGALKAGAHYVDACGDARLYALLSYDAFADQGLAAALSAGFVPGLSALLVRSLALRFDHVISLVCYFGGKDRFTLAGAMDYLIGLDTGDAEMLASWRDGKKVRHGADVRHDVELPYFGDRVTLRPFMSQESERLAVSLNLTEGTWFSFLEGKHVQDMLRRRREPSEKTAIELQRAAELDLVGSAPTQRLLLEISGTRNNAPTVRSAILEVRDTAALTGWMSAHIAECILSGQFSPGVFYASDVPDLQSTIEGLAHVPCVALIAAFDHSLLDVDLVEEGVL